MHFFRRSTDERRNAARDNILNEFLSEEQEIVLGQDDDDSLDPQQPQQPPQNQSQQQLPQRVR